MSQRVIKKLINVSYLLIIRNITVSFKFNKIKSLYVYANIFLIFLFNFLKRDTWSIKIISFLVHSGKFRKNNGN